MKGIPPRKVIRLQYVALEWAEVKYLSRVVKIENRGLCLEYGLIAGAMGLALLAVTPILASSLSALGH